jgi:putative ABC transport system permease protein
MTLLTLVWRNLRRYPRRSVLTIAGLAICVASFVLLSGVADGLQQSYLELYRRNGADLIVQRSGASDRIGNTISDNLANDIRLLPGVRGITSGLFDIISLEDADLPAVFINGWSADSPYFDGLEFLTGGKFRSGETRQAILGRTIATALGKSVGDRVQLYDESFQIVGVF